MTHFIPPKAIFYKGIAEEYYRNFDYYNSIKYTRLANMEIENWNKKTKD